MTCTNIIPQLLKNFSSHLFGRILVWPKDAVGALTIRSGDVERLSDGTFLNDIIINFYLRYLHTVRV